MKQKLINIARDELKFYTNQSLTTCACCGIRHFSNIVPDEELKSHRLEVAFRSARKCTRQQCKDAWMESLLELKDFVQDRSRLAQVECNFVCLKTKMKAVVHAQLIAPLEERLANAQKRDT